MKLRDRRAAPADLTVPAGPFARPDSVRVVHSVGSAVIVEKVVTLELDRAARELGERSVYVPTARPAWPLPGWGIAVDHVISDYVAGAGERRCTRGPNAATCSSSRARAPLFTLPIRGSRLVCCTAQRPTT